MFGFSIFVEDLSYFKIELTLRNLFSVQNERQNHIGHIKGHRIIIKLPVFFYSIIIYLKNNLCNVQEFLPNFSGWLIPYVNVTSVALYLYINDLLSAKNNVFKKSVVRHVICSTEFLYWYGKHLSAQWRFTQYDENNECYWTREDNYCYIITV